MKLRIGTVTSSGEPSLTISEELLDQHLAIFGGTRYGKSKLIELICRQLIVHRLGFAFIDPHSDTADDLRDYVCAQSLDTPFLKRKIHYLNPSQRLFSFNPFKYCPDPNNPDERTDAAYRKWLHAKIKDMVKIICRVQGETEDEAQKMVRLRRWLYNALYGVGVRQDEAGTCLPLKDALILLNPQHPMHEDRYCRVVSHLSDEVRADFEKLRRIKDPRKQEEWIESTLNRLRDILSPTLQEIFDPTHPSVDFAEIVGRGEILLASLGKTRFFHEDEAMAVAGLLIREISEAVRVVRRDSRRTFHLFIDEAHNFLGDDLIRLLKESAKYKLRFGLAVQGLDNLRKGEIDMVPAVLGQCGIRITFRQQFHEHAETLAKSFCYPQIDFTELYQEVDRFDGYDVILTPSVTVGDSQASGVNWTLSDSTQWGVGAQISTGVSESFGESVGTSSSTGRSYSTGRTHSEGATASQMQNVSLSSSKSAGIGWGGSLTRSEGTSRSLSQTTGTSFSASQSEQHSMGTSDTRGRSSGETTSIHQGQNDANGHSLSVKEGWPIHGTTIGNSNNQSQSHGLSHSSNRSTAEHVGVARGTTHGEALHESQSHQAGVSNTISHGINQSQNHSVSKGVQSGVGFGRGLTITNGQSASESRTEQLSHSIGRNHSKTNSRQIGFSETATIGHSKSHGRSETETKSRTVSLQLAPLQRIRVDKQRTGRLVLSTQDQFAKFAAMISSLQKRQCLVAVAAFNTTFSIEVSNVEAPFGQMLISPTWQLRQLRRFHEELVRMRSYFLSCPERKRTVEPDNPDPNKSEDLPFTS